METWEKELNLSFPSSFLLFFLFLSLFPFFFSSSSSLFSVRRLLIKMGQKQNRKEEVGDWKSSWRSDSWRVSDDG